MPNHPYPPGRVKIVNAVYSLLSEKDFNSITTAEIAKTAGVTEGLIYKYFKDKRDLLYQVLKEYFEGFWFKLQKNLAGIVPPIDRLEEIIRFSLDFYAENRVFARIILVEVRNSPDFFESEAYELVKKYSTGLILSTIEEGMKTGAFRDDLDPSTVRYAVMGAIEHACLPWIIFKREIDPEELTRNICAIVFSGIRT